mgnify:FL=1
MRNLERLIARARNMLSYGLTQEEVVRELEALGNASELVHWAIRGAKFELDYQEELENAKLQG